MFGTSLEWFWQGAASSEGGLADTLFEVYLQLRLEAEAIAEANPQVRILSFHDLTLVSRQTSREQHHGRDTTFWPNSFSPVELLK